MTALTAPFNYDKHPIFVYNGELCFEYQGQTFSWAPDYRSHLFQTLSDRITKVDMEQRQSNLKIIALEGKLDLLLGLNTKLMDMMTELVARGPVPPELTRRMQEILKEQI